MIVRTRIFEFYQEEYKNLSQLAQAMGISVSQIYRVRQGKRCINQKFIVGALQAFPDLNLDKLFYLEVDASDGMEEHYRHDNASPVDAKYSSLRPQTGSTSLASLVSVHVRR